MLSRNDETSSSSWYFGGLADIAMATLMASLSSLNYHLPAAYGTTMQHGTGATNPPRIRYGMYPIPKNT